MAFYGCICGIHVANKWGDIKTLMGRAILMFSLGLLMQTMGQLIDSIYIIYFHIPIPYPSLGEIPYFGSIPVYICAAYLLAAASGIKVNIQSYRQKILALIVPILMLGFGYFLFLQGYKFDWNNPIKIIEDFGYPLGEAIYISIALITFIFSRTILDGIMKSRAMLMLFALGAQYMADYIFVYQSDQYFAGCYMDLLYLIAYFIMTMALLNLKSIRVSIPID
jgi:hypothetical protein